MSVRGSLILEHGHTAELPLVVKIETKSLVKPSKSIEAAQIADASNMYGLRRPKRDFELSAITPMYSQSIVYPTYNES